VDEYCLARMHGLSSEDRELKRERMELSNRRRIGSIYENCQHTECAVRRPETVQKDKGEIVDFVSKTNDNKIMTRKTGKE